MPWSYKHTWATRKCSFLKNRLFWGFFLEWEETLQQIRNSVKSTVDIFPIQFSYLSFCVDWEKSNKLGESKLTKLSLLTSQIKIVSFLSTHELLGPGPLIPLGLSTTSEHLTPLCLFAKTSINNRQNSSKARDLKWWNSAQPGQWDMQMWDFMLWTTQRVAPGLHTSLMSV